MLTFLARYLYIPYIITQVWISYGQFECNTDTEGCLEVGRQIFRRGYDSLKSQGLKEERVLLLEAWRDCEVEASQINPNTTQTDSSSTTTHGDVSIVDKMMPRKMKMRRVIHVDGTSGGEE